MDPTDNVEDGAPLWKYVTKIEKNNEGGGNTKFSCNYCHGVYNGSYSRVKAHLLKIKKFGIKMCPKVSIEHINEMQKLEDEAERRKQPKQVPLATNTSQSSSGTSEMFRKRKLVGDSPLEKSFNNESRENMKSEIARMFYSGGLPFHFSRNPHYINAFTYAANHTLIGFIPPGYNALRTTLLQKERAHIERLLRPLKGTWGEKGVSIVSDGWTDAQKRPLINFMATSEGGPIFLKAVDGTKEYKDKHYIARLLLDVINDVGPQNVVQVIIDNAPVMKSAGSLVEAEYPSIFWTPCVVHTLNLALKNICAVKNTDRNERVYIECHWITEVADDTSFIRNFIVNHSMRLAMFNEFSPLKLLAVAETRFASVVIMLKRLKFIKKGLQSMVISEEWSSYREDDVGKAAHVKDLVLNYIWWDKVDYILSFTGPIYDMLRFADTDKPILHTVYDMWDTMIEKVKKVIFRHEGKEENETSLFYDVIYGILIDRWTKSCTPLHCLAHSLNPRYYSDQWLNESSNHILQHKDEEICAERNKCLRRYFSDNESRRKVNVEYARFSGSMDQLGEYDSLDDRWNLEPKVWWYVHGASLPLLQSLAFKLLGQPCSSSCCERNWSTYSFIHSLRRNKITPKRAEDLVFIHTNLRLLSRKSEDYMKGSTKMWDIAGDTWDEPFGGAGELEIANLSLDEPDMETVMFTDDDDVDATANDD